MPMIRMDTNTFTKQLKWSPAWLFIQSSALRELPVRLFLDMNHPYIPTFIVTEPVITGYTPAMVVLAETIAGSQILADKVEAFASLSEPGPEDTSNAASTFFFSLGVMPFLLASTLFMGALA